MKTSQLAHPRQLPGRRGARSTTAAFAGQLILYLYIYIYILKEAGQGEGVLFEGLALWQKGFVGLDVAFSTRAVQETQQTGLSGVPAAAC